MPDPDLAVAGGRQLGGLVEFHYNGPIGLVDLEAVAAAKKFYRAVSP